MSFVTTDLRYSLRSLRANPLFAAVAIATLGLGIGATTALFGIVNGVLLEPFPLGRPEQLVLVGHQYQGFNSLKTGVSAAGFAFYRDQNRAFSRAAAVTGWEANYSAQGDPVRLRGQRVTADYFRTLEARMVAGRSFTAAEELEGADRVVVVSEAMWKRYFGADPALVGRTIQLNGEGHLVVGIVDRALEFGREPSEVWKPLTFTAEQRAGCWGCEWMSMVARLRPGTTIEAARADADRLAKGVRELSASGRDQKWGLWVNPLAEELVGDARTPLLVLLGAVGFVLLIACVNVANLLLARATTRRREVAIRTAMGASRGRLLAQLLTESAVLSVAGTGLGLLLAAGTIRVLKLIDPSNLPRIDAVTLDARVVSFAILLGVVTPLLFGLGPAWFAARAELFGLVKDGVRGTGEGLGRIGPRALLVSAEVALALMLLVGAGLMIRSVRVWLSVDSGFRPDSVLTFRASLPEAGYPDQARQVAFHEQVRERLRASPAVLEAGASVSLPMGNDNWTMSYLVEGSKQAENQRAWGEFRMVTAGFTDALGIEVLKGRAFDRTDVAGGRRVAVVDRLLAEQYWPGIDPIGRRVGFDGRDSVSWFDVVGVVEHVIAVSPRADRRTQLYILASQSPRFGVAQMTFAVRTRGAPESAIGVVREAVRAVDPAQAIYDVKPMTAWVSASSANQRFLMATLGAFAAVALVLAAIGVYGLMTFAVSQATREIGVRMALGASVASVRRLVLRRALVLAGGGAAVGLGGALLLSRGLQSQLFGVTPADPVTLIGMPLVLGAVAFLAGWIPARRATRIEPVVALKVD